jgi:5-(carboxyamino)imidazole ribonucleotide mutase
VATVAIGGGRNAGILALQILASAAPKLQLRLLRYKAALATASRKRGHALAGPTSRPGARLCAGKRLDLTATKPCQFNP